MKDLNENSIPLEYFIKTNLHLNFLKQSSNQVTDYQTYKQNQVTLENFKMYNKQNYHQDDLVVNTHCPVSDAKLVNPVRCQFCTHLESTNYIDMIKCISNHK